MEKNVSQTPFLRILEPENLSKIKIDDELIPAFRTVILKINDYFIENDLMDVKDWDSFFEKYLLTEDKNQNCIKVWTDFTGEICGEYKQEEKQIRVLTNNRSNEEICHYLCHEIVHFLVMNALDFNARPLSDCSYINEGMTELLTDNVMRDNITDIYDGERQFASLYCTLSYNKNPFRYFLNNSFSFKFDNIYTYRNISMSGKKLKDDDLDDELIRYHKHNLLQYIIDSTIEDCTIASFEEYTSIIDRFSDISLYLEKNEYQKYLEKIVDIFLDNYNLDLEDERKTKEQLLTLAGISKKAHIYGNKEVAEYMIDDVCIAFDKYGNDYSESKKKWRVDYSARNKTITVRYKEKTYIINTNNMECRNWESIYENYFTEIQTLIELLDKKRKYVEHTNRNITFIQDTEIKNSEEDSEKLSGFEEQEKKEIEVFSDPDGRRFISTKDAKSLGFNNPRDVLYLPTEKISDIVGYKFITEEEYNLLKTQYIITDERVGKLDVIFYNGNYYVDWLALQSRDDSYDKSQFYEFDSSVFNEEPLSKLQFERIRKYYSINIVTEKDLKRNDEEFQPQNDADKEVPSEKTTISFVETIFSDKFEAERQKIMNARFSEEDKQRMLKELEEEYRNNNFVNNSGRTIR